MRVHTPTSAAAGQRVPGKRANERIVAVTDPQTGKAVFVPASMAADMEPAPSDRRPERLYSIEDPVTGATSGYQTREEALAAGQSPKSGEGENETLQARAEAAFDALGPEWNESFDWINPFVDSDEKVAGASKEEFVARLMEAVERNPGVPDDELARRLAAEFTG